jgi:hypothetical protein
MNLRSRLAKLERRPVSGRATWKDFINSDSEPDSEEWRAWLEAGSIEFDEVGAGGEFPPDQDVTSSNTVVAKSEGEDEDPAAIPSGKLAE